MKSKISMSVPSSEEPAMRAAESGRPAVAGLFARAGSAVVPDMGYRLRVWGGEGQAERRASAKSTALPVPSAST